MLRQWDPDELQLERFIERQDADPDGPWGALLPYTTTGKLKDNFLAGKKRPKEERRLVEFAQQSRRPLDHVRLPFLTWQESGFTATGSSVNLLPYSCEIVKCSTSWHNFSADSHNLRFVSLPIYHGTPFTGTGVGDPDDFEIASPLSRRLDEVEFVATGTPQSSPVKAETDLLTDASSDTSSTPTSSDGDSLPEDDVLRIGANLQTPVMEGADLVVGHLKKVKRLSRDSRFRFCLLDIGQDQDIAVMSAAANVRAGVKVLVCLEGGTVLGTGEVVHAVIIEGVESRGILCGPVELGWEEGAPGESVVHLSWDFEVGDVVEWGYFEEEIVRESLTNWTLKHDVEDSSGASVSAGDEAAAGEVESELDREGDDDSDTSGLETAKRRPRRRFNSKKPSSEGELELPHHHRIQVQKESGRHVGKQTAPSGLKSAGKVDELAGREQMGATPKALSYVSRSGAESPRTPTTPRTPKRESSHGSAVTDGSTGTWPWYNIHWACKLEVVCMMCCQGINRQICAQPGTAHIWSATGHFVSCATIKKPIVPVPLLKCVITSILLFTGMSLSFLQYPYLRKVRDIFFFEMRTRPEWASCRSFFVPSGRSLTISKVVKGSLRGGDVVILFGYPGEDVTESVFIQNYDMTPAEASVAVRQVKRLYVKDTLSVSVGRVSAMSQWVVIHNLSTIRGMSGGGGSVLEEPFALLFVHSRTHSDRPEEANLAISVDNPLFIAMYCHEVLPEIVKLDDSKWPEGHAGYMKQRLAEWLKKHEVFIEKLGYAEVAGRFLDRV